MMRRWLSAVRVQSVGFLLGGLFLPGSRVGPLHAAERLDLDTALSLALRQNPELRAAAAGEEASDARVATVRAGLLPRIDYSESATRSNNPVYVFGTLLTQQRFGPENFAVDALNRPEARDNFQSRVFLQQTLFEWGRYLEIQSARRGRELAGEMKRQAEMETLLGTLTAYFGVQVAEANERMHSASLASAEADLERTRARLEQGLATEADVLSIRVQLASIQEQRIRAANQRRLMQAELNRVLGEPLDREFELSTALEPVSPPPVPPLAELERKAAEGPEAQRLALELQMARLAVDKARSSFFPQLGLTAGWESDRVSFAGGGGTNWAVGVSLQWNLFDGLSRRAGLQEAAANQRRKQAETAAAIESVRLEVRRAYFDQQAARERVRVAETAVAEARESHRITAARYEAGLAGVTELLRSQSAALEAETRFLAALYDDRLAAARLEMAAGILNRTSEALKP
jgi:outer membrane protein